MIVGFEWDFDREEPPISPLTTPFAKGSVVRALVLVPPLGHSVIRSSAASLRNKKFDSFRGEQGMWCQLSTDCFFSLVETMCLGLGLYYSAVQCTIYSVQWTMYSYSVQCTVYSGQCTLGCSILHPMGACNFYHLILLCLCEIDTVTKIGFIALNLGKRQHFEVYNGIIKNTR